MSILTPTGVRLDESPSQLVTYPDVLQGSDEWLDQRQGMVTASVVGRLVSNRLMAATDHTCPACGALAMDACVSKRTGWTGTPIKNPHPERTALAARLRHESPRIVEAASGDEARTLAALLAAERISSHTDDAYVSDDMFRGHEIEPQAIDVYGDHKQVLVESCGFMVRNWGPFRLGFSPDGLVGEAGFIEVKSRRPKKHLLTVISGEVPPENMAQIQAGLLVSGREWADYISFCGGMALWVKRVLPETRWFEAITTAVETFEAAATEMVAAYRKGVEGMPMTERPVEEMWI